MNYVAYNLLRDHQVSKLYNSRAN